MEVMMPIKRGTIVVTTVYRRKGGKSYYFKYTDLDGKRHQLSTGKANKRDATLYAQAFVDRLAEGNRTERMTLSELISLYEDPATNPRRKDALVNGGNYTIRYALMVARYAKVLHLLLSSSPYISMQLSSLTKRDIKDIASIIVEKHGRRRKSQMIYSVLKVALSQAESDGIMVSSPAMRLPNIRYTENKRQAIPPEMVQYLLSHPELFPSPEYHAFITVVATTGMRRGEALAIHEDKLHDGVLTIDSQFTTGAMTEPVPPKWCVTRIIPLPSLALAALDTLTRKDGYYFPHYDRWTDINMGKLKAALKAADPKRADKWAKLGHHVLRHSANTNLLVSGALPVLVAEYLAWKHQELMDMQRRYTSMVAMNLKPIADKLDEIYTPSEKILTFSKQGNV
jgi:integrase